MRINRGDLLKQLLAVDAGLSSSDEIEQGSSYVFREGRVFTFNDEVACSHDCVLNPDPDVAVSAAPLRTILSKLVEDDVDVSLKEGELLVKGKRRRAGIRVEKEIALPLGEIEKPDEWHELPDGFSEAVRMASQCAGDDESSFALRCIHVHPEWVESCDGMQAIRCSIETGLKSPVLVKRDSVKTIVGVGMSELSQTDNWLHFRNESGSVLSCRKWEEEYFDLADILKVEGADVSFPKELPKAVAMAGTFLNDKVGDDAVSLELRNGRLRLRGEGVDGWYEELMKLEYDGEPLSFRIAPRLLVEVCKRIDKGVIEETKIKVEGDDFVYVSSLGTEGEEEED